MTSFDMYALQHLVACFLHAFCILSACCTNVYCPAVTCDSVMALRSTFNFWHPHTFTFLLYYDCHSFVLLHICPIVHHHHALIANAGTDLLPLFPAFPAFDVQNALLGHQGISANDLIPIRTARDVVSWVIHALS